MKFIRVFLVFYCLLLLGCSQEGNISNEQYSPTTIFIGVLPDESLEAMNVKYKELIEYLSNTTKQRYQMVYPETYAHLLELFSKNKVDMALFGGVTFITAMQQYGAEPLVMRDKDTVFTSFLIANKKLNIKNLQELKKHSFSFGSKLSTSGHIMPRYFLKEIGVEPESFFSTINYTKNHTQTIMGVTKGAVDAGVANSLVVEKLISESLEVKNSIDIIWQSKPYPDYVWAVNGKLDFELSDKIRAAFLLLSKDNALHKTILNKLQADYYLTATENDFDLLLEALKFVNKDINKS